MSSNTQMARLVTERRKRLVASIMGYLEREVYRHLTTSEQRELRLKVLGAVDEFADLMRDVLKVSSDGEAVNEHAIELLEALHDGQRQLAKRLS